MRYVLEATPKNLPTHGETNYIEFESKSQLISKLFYIQGRALHCSLWVRITLAITRSVKRNNVDPQLFDYILEEPTID